jgi:hypothetical protein
MAGVGGARVLGLDARRATALGLGAVAGVALIAWGGAG